MKSRALIALIAIFMTILLTTELVSRNTKPNNDNKKVVATVGKEQITYQQLEKAFQKNMNRRNVSLRSIPKDSVVGFLNLFTNYRLKVNDALRRGFDKDPSVEEDIKQNRKILAESFFFEKKLTDRYMEKWVKMREKEYKVAVIITAFGFNNDTTTAYNKITQALIELESGVPFKAVATKFSDDRETAEVGGVVSRYITAGNVNRILEEEIYKLKQGEYSKNYIRTSFGYFLIKVLDEKPRKYLKLRNLYVDSDNEQGLSYLKNHIDSLVKVVRSGKASFESIARQHSREKKTSQEGGFIGGYYTRSTGVNFSGEVFLSELEDAFYSLKPGELTDPINIMNGFHVFYLDSIVDIDLVAERDDLRTLYRRLYFNDDRKILIDSLAIKYGFKLHFDSFHELLSKLDTTQTTIDENWNSNIDDKLKSKILYSFNKKNFTIYDFLNELTTKPEFRGTPLSFDGLNRAIERVIEPRVFDLATANLETDYPEFAELVREFRDGILLFKVEAMEVWDKMKFDSLVARSFYDTTSMDLTRSAMYDIFEIYLINENEMNELHSRIVSGDIEFERAAKQFTQRTGMREKEGHLGSFTALRHRLVQEAVNLNLKPGDISKPIPYENGFSIIKINSYEPARRKTFEEAIPDIAPRVQDIVQKELTNQWLDRIRKNFPVNVNMQVINSIFK